MKIFPAVTTIFDWRSKLKEVKELNLKEVALFLTCANYEERQEIYDFLKETKIEKVPFAHIRTDMQMEEMEYLIKIYHTEVFNIHTKREYQYPADYEKYKKMIYIENTYEPFDEKEIKDFAGICLDVAHLENSRIFKPELYNHNIKVIEKYGCGCNHISPTKNFSLYDVKKEDESENWNAHVLDNLSQLDYLKSYPKKYFGKLAAIEMENSIKDQLKARDYMLKLLGQAAS
ncbi:MAG: hypothetical protein HYW69_01475 [Candidatus Nealsonbacteria bacterium]|nr:hypothetical protein [Candidatus Nealsonbacteria bacterium]